MPDVINLETPWDYKTLTPEGRKEFDTQLLALEKKAHDARQVRNFIVDEEYWLSTDSPKRNIMESIYDQRVAAGEILPRPA